MNVPVLLVGVLQRVDLETQVSTNMLEIQLPTGYRITCSISEKDAMQVIGASVGVSGQELEESAPPTPMGPEVWTPNFELASVVEEEPSFVRPRIAELDSLRKRVPNVREHAYIAKNGATTKVLTVPKDEMGNPIVPSTSGLEADGVDEDGVPAA